VAGQALAAIVVVVPAAADEAVVPVAGVLPLLDVAAEIVDAAVAVDLRLTLVMARHRRGRGAKAAEVVVEGIPIRIGVPPVRSARVVPLARGDVVAPRCVDVSSPDRSAEALADRLAIGVGVTPIDAHLRVLRAPRLADVRALEAGRIRLKRVVLVAPDGLPSLRGIRVEPRLVLRARHLGAVDAVSLGHLDERRAASAAVRNAVAVVVERRAAVGRLWSLTPHAATPVAARTILRGDARPAAGLADPDLPRRPVTGFGGADLTLADVVDPVVGQAIAVVVLRRGAVARLRPLSAGARAPVARASALHGDARPASRLADADSVLRVRVAVFLHDVLALLNGVPCDVRWTVVCVYG